MAHCGFPLLPPGAHEDVGRHLLDACGGNLEMAIGMHMDAPSVTHEADQANAAAANLPVDSTPDK